jgi:ribosome maturation factor RimP
MISEERIQNILEKEMVSGDIFIVDIKVRAGNKINIWVDKDQGITIDECVKISRYVENQLDRETEDFELEVSSPGLDMPFKVRRQYEKNLNNMVRITLTDDSTLKGKLVEVTDHDIEVEHFIKGDKKKGKKEKVRTRHSFKQIKSTKAVIEFK